MRKMTLALLGAFALVAPAHSSDGWKPLLDATFSQFDVYLSYRGDQIMSVLKGTAPPDLKPVGLNPKGQNGVHDDRAGRQARAAHQWRDLRLRDHEAGVLELPLPRQFKWGDKKWEPRLAELKDSGILYHSRGAFGVDYWKSWALSQEFQVIEHGIGEYWRIGDLRDRHPRGPQGAWRRRAEMGSRRRRGWRSPDPTTTRSRVRMRIARANGTRSSSSASRIAACTSSTARSSWR